MLVARWLASVVLPSRLRALRRAYLPLPPDVRAPSQTARIHPTEFLQAPLVQAVAQTIRLDSERLADRYESERPVTVAVQNPPFGLAENLAPGAAQRLKSDRQGALGVKLGVSSSELQPWFGKDLIPGFVL